MWSSYCCHLLSLGLIDFEDMALSTAWLERFWVYNRDTPRVCCIFRNLTFISFIGHCSAMLPWKEFLLWSRNALWLEDGADRTWSFRAWHIAVCFHGIDEEGPQTTAGDNSYGATGQPGLLSILMPSSIFFDSKHGVFGFLNMMQWMFWAGVCCTQSGRARVAWHSILKSSRRLTHGDLQGAQVVKPKSWLILSNALLIAWTFCSCFPKSSEWAVAVSYYAWREKRFYSLS